ncbi:hypothetical protein M422DRAFT_262056 [Sphaerobolus stellatus SS14]|nr:hypothetical protein M422DRAFT_262056 [Sphaerobolus stellatus SS14]
MSSLLSQVIETSRIPSYFSYLPVRIHKEVAAIDAATFDAIEVCAPPASKERKQAIYRHTNPYGNPYALCHGECDIKKLEYFVKVVEMIWIDDDVTEEFPHTEALSEHEILCQGLHPEFDNNTETGKTVVNAPTLLNTLDTYLQEYDNSDVNFQTVEEYLPFASQMQAIALSVCTHFTRWAMELHLTEKESSSMREFEWTLGDVLALTNDYFSWNKEKYQSSTASAMLSPFSCGNTLSQRSKRDYC